MHKFDDKYNENLEVKNLYLENGKAFCLERKELPLLDDVLLHMIWGDRVTNIIKYGMILSGIMAAVTYASRNTEDMLYRAIAIGVIGSIITSVIAFVVNTFVVESPDDDSVIVKPSCWINHMENDLSNIDPSKLSSEYLIFKGCANQDVYTYLRAEGRELGASTSDIKNLLFNKVNSYGLSDFLLVSNVRKMYIIKERKRALDICWNSWLEQTGLEEVIDLTQMYNDLYTYVVCDIVSTGGEELTTDQKIHMATYILDALGVKNKVSVKKHMKNMENNDVYREYMSNCFYELEPDKTKSAGAFWQILSCKRDGTGRLLHHNIRFLEEFRRFYVQLIIFLYDMHLYNEATAISITNVVMLYYHLSKDIDNHNLDKAVKKKNIINVLAPIEFDMEKYMKSIQEYV